MRYECQWILLAGKNKGKPCGKKCDSSKFCFTHYDKAMQLEQQKYEEDFKKIHGVTPKQYERQKLEEFKKSHDGMTPEQYERYQQQVKERERMEQYEKQREEELKQSIEKYKDDFESQFEKVKEWLDDYLDAYFDPRDCYMECLGSIGVKVTKDRILTFCNDKKYKISLVPVEECNEVE